MNYFLSVSIILMFCFTSIGQDSRIFYRNNIQLNTGYTFYDGFSGGHSLNQRGVNRFTAIASYDGFLTEKLSIGLFCGLTSSTLKEDGVYYQEDWYSDGELYSRKIKERRYVLGVKGSTYFINTEKLQVFLGAGVALGRKRDYTRYGKELYVYDNRNFVFMYDLHLGVNYYFSEHWGATGSLGYPLALFRFGMTYRY